MGTGTGCYGKQGGVSGATWVATCRPARTAEQQNLASRLAGEDSDFAMW
jgi:hypothetical protein